MPSRIQPAPPSVANANKPSSRVGVSSGKPDGQVFLETLSTARRQKSRDAKAAEAAAPARKAETSIKAKKPRKRAAAEDAAPVETTAQAEGAVTDGAAADKPAATETTGTTPDEIEVEAAPVAQKDKEPTAEETDTLAVAGVAQQAATIATDTAGTEQAEEMTVVGGDASAAAVAAGAMDLSGLVEAEGEEPSTAPATASPAGALPRPARPSQASADAGADAAESEQQGSDADPAAAIASAAAEGAAEDAAPADGESDVLGSAKPQAAVASANGAGSLTSAPTGDAPRAGDATKSVAPAPAPPAPTPERFAELNHSRIVTAARAELLPNGGTMQIKLDPPELGALQVTVRMLDGVVTASFQTSNDEATRLLSHSLAQLKHVLESQGVTVDKIHVQQAPRDQQASNDDQRQQQQNEQWDESARHEQQRKEMLRRMWRRLSIGSDPLDLVA